MAEILLFHHAQGQTTGFHAFADEIRAAGHAVHTPDLYDGNTFASLDDGVGYAKQVGFDAIGERGRRAVDGLPNKLVYAAFSLGVMPAQELAQTRPGATGALLFSAAFPASEFGGEMAEGSPASDPHDGRRRMGQGKIFRPHASSPRSSTMRSCSCTPATDTCSPTAACRITTNRLRGCSCNASKRFWRAPASRRNLPVNEASSEETPYGRYVRSDGWFVLNLCDALALRNEEKGGAVYPLEARGAPFRDFGVSAPVRLPWPLDAR